MFGKTKKKRNGLWNKSTTGNKQEHLRNKVLDSRFRGNDGMTFSGESLILIILSKQMKTTQYFILFLLVVSFLCGCGKKLDVTVVTGTVTVDGQPMEEIKIVFVPSDETGLAAFGTTDASGKFRLSSPSRPVGSGAKPGEYIPTFSKEELVSTASGDQGQAPPTGMMVSAPPPKIIQHIPEKYGNAKTSGFDPVKVEKGKKNDFVFELSTK